MTPDASRRRFLGAAASAALPVAVGTSETSTTYPGLAGRENDTPDLLIPPEACEEAGIQVGDYLEVVARDGSLVIRPTGESA